ncbi:uncharacterized protein LOC143848883 [Tasmannia lanceolata]|uniref:uncharacterized protein LOC143848883 n=1 Tax=Tasmannia lanceolata TaxID=3420 RepID=UPI0040638504
MVARRNKNSIQGTITPDGSYSSDPEVISNVMVDFFNNILNSNGLNPEAHSIPDPIRILSPNQIEALSKPFSMDEIRETIFASDGSKAPGPDGFNGDFYKSFWYLIKENITEAILSFFIKGKMLPELNCTFITLVPKSPDASSPENYRPIALCNFLYKIISKLMANRLKLIMDNLISPFQSAFIQGSVNSTRRAVCTILRMSEGSLPIKYLGLPLITSRLTAADCLPILEKIQKRISVWTNKSLSRAGRAELIKSVLSTYQVYWSAAFHIPRSVLEKIEKIFRDFFWSGCKRERKWQNISWETICKPKREGGLGIRSLIDMNRAAQIKQLWHILNGKNIPWVRWFDLKYLRNRSIWSIKMPSNPSWAARSIINARSFILPNVCYIVNPLSKLNFWNDPWHPNGPISSQTSVLSNFIPPSASILRTFEEGWWNMILTLPQLWEFKMILDGALFSDNLDSKSFGNPKPLENSLSVTLGTQSDPQNRKSSGHRPFGSRATF